MRPQLFVRSGGRVVPAPDEDIEVAEGYERWPEKGDIQDGRRLTIMTASRRVTSGEPVRVIHVLEVVDTGLPVYISGPKRIFDEFVDGRLASAPLPAGADPWLPLSYDGRVLTAPRLDFNWDITSYELDAAGSHEIVWKPGSFVSNRLLIEVEGS